MKTEWQIIHTHANPDDLRIELLTLLKEAFGEEYIEKTIEEIEGAIEIKYGHHSNDKFITGFTLFLDEDQKIAEIIKIFGGKMQDAENINLVLKFYDEKTLVNFNQYSQEIFEMEMKLREVMSFIFLATYRDDYYDLLREINIRIQKLNNNYPDESYYTAHYENEFFFLLFSDYLKLDRLKEIKPSELILEIVDSENYDSLKQKFTNRGIAKEEYREFMAEVKQNLEPIENLRNCIAHNRSITDTIRENYLHAKEGLEESIYNFWNSIQNAE